MDQRREELERKRQRLAELRRAREAREHAQAAAPPASPSKPPAAPTPVPQDQPLDVTVDAEAPPRQARKPVLTAELVALVELQGSETLTYSKEVQTEPAMTADAGCDAPPASPPPATPEPQPSPQPLPQPSADRDAVLRSPAFAAFVHDATALVERVLKSSTQWDPHTSYTRADSGIDASGAGAAGGLQPAGVLPGESGRLHSVAQVDWSHHHAELVLAASTSANPAAAAAGGDASVKGTVRIHNIHVPERPEFVLESASQATSARFSPFDAHIVHGATYSGRVAVWDLRAGRRPVLQSAQATAGLDGDDGQRGHAMPVFALEAVGGAAAHQIVTGSTDGVLCAWQPEMLARPAERLELVRRPRGALAATPVSLTSLAFPAGRGSAQCVVGAQDGSVLLVERFNRADARAGVSDDNRFQPHTAPVTSLACHPNSGAVLSAGMDWTVRLQPFSPESVAPRLMCDAFDSAVADARWCPLRDALFSTVNVDGGIQLWDSQNLDAEVPCHVWTCDEPLTRCAWQRGGALLAVGTSTGLVRLFDASLALESI